MKKFLIGVLLLLAVLSGCGQPPEAEALAEEGTLCGTLTAFKREGIYVQTEKNVSYCFELPCGIDLSDFEVGDKVCISYNTEHGPVADHVAAVEVEYGALFLVCSDSFTISLGGGAAMTFEYGESIDMDAFEQGDRLRVEYYVDSYHTEAIAVSRAQED